MASNSTYFMGRAEILGWINETLRTKIQKIEDTANGAVACQLMDALFPGTVPIKKVDCNAKNEYDMINNYKVLQDVFNKHGVDKYVDVNKLIKAKPMDNTEFMQWFKMYFDNLTGGQPVEYDGPARRSISKTGDYKTMAGPSPAIKAQHVQSNARISAAITPNRRAPSWQIKAPQPHNSSPPAASARAVNDMSGQLSDANLRADTLEKEKEFYYSKLRDIELLCQTPTICELPAMQRVEAILYAPTAEDGRQALIEAQKDLAGGVFLEVEEPLPEDEGSGAQA